MHKQWLVWRRIAWIAVIIVLVLACVYGALWLRWPLSSKTALAVTERVTTNWWDHPAPMSETEAEVTRFISSVTWQLPRTEWTNVWRMGGARQVSVNSIRYHAAFAGYAAAVTGMHTPAYPELTAKIMRNTIEHLLDRFTWHYVEYYWKDTPTFPDPVAFENIMYSGHLLNVLVFYEAMTGDTRYRTNGFDFVWDEKTSFHYDTLLLAEVIASQMRRSASGGVCCEPGLIFFPCNNHPQVALLTLESMGLGQWADERQRWEQFALSSFGTVFGGGAFKLLYMPQSKLFVPRGVPGLDGWSILWYYPWAADPARARAIWNRVATYIDWTLFTERHRDETNVPGASFCCGMGDVSPPVLVAAFDFPAAVCAGDQVTAGRLKEWLERVHLVRTNGLAFLQTDVNGQIGATANYLIGLSLANGTDARALVQHPLPRNYFDEGPWIETATPAATIYCAYRAGSNLVVELSGPTGTFLRLRNMPSIRQVEGIPESAWTYCAPDLKLNISGRHRLVIHPSACFRNP